MQQRVSLNEQMDVFVLGGVTIDPHVSNREISAIGGIDQSSVWCILKRNRFCPVRRNRF
jgi:hypothetical protein